MLLAVIWKGIKSASEPPLYSIEAYITTLFGFGSDLATLSYTLPPKIRRASFIRTSRLTEILMTLLFSGLGIYMLWFWFQGIHVLVSDFIPN